MQLKSSKLDSYGKFKIEEQRKFKNNVWTSYNIINDIKNYIKNHDYNFKTALDPCAGSGRLLKEFNEYEWTAFEINATIIEECIESQDLKNLITIADFLNVSINKTFDVCICNPPYNKNVGINKWIKKILSCCDMLFLVVPYNYITKIKQQKNLIDCIPTANGMDENYHTQICVFVFSSQPQEVGFYEKHNLFYIKQEPEHNPKGLSAANTQQEPIYLRDYLKPLTLETIKRQRIKEIPEGKTYPVYTIANNPVKYTDLKPNCPGDVVLLNRSYLASCNVLKYSEKECFLNENFGVYKVKEEKKDEFLKMFTLINAYLIKLFKLNHANTPLKIDDILNIPIYIGNTYEEFLNEELNKYLKRFKYLQNIKNLNVEWL